MPNSNVSATGEKRRRSKPKKPYPDFPLTANGNGQWSKVIRRKTYYFGPWEDPQAALNRYLEVRDDLQAGRTPRPKDAVTVRDICNHYLVHQEAKRDRGDISPRTFADCRDHCKLLVDTLGTLVAAEVGPQDFTRLLQSYPIHWKPATRAHHINLARAVFTFADDQDLIPHRVKFGEAFRKPDKRVFRRARSGRKRCFNAEELQRILKTLATDNRLKHPQLRAMVLLGINCGFGNRDCAKLTEDVLDLKAGWITYPRPKTGIMRRCPLWTETIDVLQEVLSSRKPRDDGFVFVTKYGNPWFTDVGRHCPVSLMFGKLVRKLNIEGSFYGLRHTFQTVCDQSGVPRYVTHTIMGHADNTISGEYSHGVTDEQLRKAVECVRVWLWEGGES